jgi:hypothetical protein
MSRREGIIAAILITCLLAGCSEESTDIVHVERPSVTQTSPEDGATDVNLNPSIRIWFDQALDEATLDSAAFYVEGANTHHLEYDDDEHMIILHLRGILEADSTYRVIATTGIKGTSGHGMLADHSFDFTTGPLDCEHLEDQFEPNDDIASAVQVELNKTYTCLSSCGADERTDFFEFTLDEAARVTVRTAPSYVDTERVSWKINFLRGESDYYSTLGTSVWSDLHQKSAYFSFLPGTYYVEIGKYHEDGHMVVYDLTMETSAPCEDDAYEDNDFMDEAVLISTWPLEGLKGCSGDRDFFSTRIDSGRTFTVTATMTISDYSIRRLRIYDPNGISVAETTFSAEGGSISRSWTATRDTVYYFKVRWWVDDVTYDLDVDVSR